MREYDFSSPLFVCLVTRYHHWQIESALEFRFIQCTAKKILSCWTRPTKPDFFFLRQAIATSPAGRGRTKGGKERDVVGFFSVRISASDSSTCKHLWSLIGPSPLRRQVPSTKGALNREREAHKLFLKKGAWEVVLHFHVHRLFLPFFFEIYFFLSCWKLV
jgi:hypothetical protein